MPIFYQQDIDVNTKLGIWKIEEDEDFFLSEVPVQRDITHPHKRLQHLSGRYLLKFLYPDFPFDLIRVATTLKPYLENEAYHFSISHCGDFAAVIVSKTQRVGVDIEIPDAKVARIKNKFLHEDELLVISGLSNPTDTRIPTALEQLTVLWSCKEAVFKWWSFGKVDFREHIRLHPSHFGESGIVRAAFTGHEQTALDIHYKIFEQICLAWVVSS